MSLSPTIHDSILLNRSGGGAINPLVTTPMDWSSFVGSTRTTTGAFPNFDATGDSQLGVASTSIALGVDGRWEATLRGTPTLAMLIAQYTNVAHDLTADSIFGLQSVNGAGANKVINAGTGNGPVNRTLNPNSVTGDVVALEFAGDQVMWKYRPTVTQGAYIAGNEYTIHRFAAARTQTVYAGGRFFGAPNGLGSLKQIIGSIYKKFGNAAVNICICGNSLMNDDGAGNLVTQISDMYPIVGRNITITNVSVAGAKWTDMTANQRAGIAAAWVNGNINILLSWSNTNDVLAGVSNAQCVLDALAFHNAVESDHHWDVRGTLETIPRDGGYANQAARDIGNNSMVALDNTFAGNVAAWGGTHFIRVRPGTVFATMPDWTPASFAAMGPIWQEGAGLEIHLTAFGDYLIAPAVRGFLVSLPYAT